MRKVVLVSAVVAAAAASVIVAPAANADCVSGGRAVAATVCVDESDNNGNGYTWLNATVPVPTFSDPFTVWLDSYDYGDGNRSWGAADNFGFVGAGQDRYNGAEFDQGGTYAYVWPAGGVAHRYDGENCMAAASVVGEFDCGPAKVPFLELPRLP